MPSRLMVLVKHALPVLDPSRPPREWLLGAEGKLQAKRLAEELRRFLPFELASSPEPKAAQTCSIMADALGVPMKTNEDLRELDRPARPIVSDEEHEEVNAGLFTSRDERVVGNESANEALARFSTAVRELLEASGETNLVIVSHGTVISLLVAEHNGIDAFELWKSLECPSYVVLDAPTLELVETSTTLAT